MLRGCDELIEGGEVEPQEAVKKFGASLDSNHSLFMLVDDGSRKEFGREIAFRANFEECIKRRRFTTKLNNAGKKGSKQAHQGAQRSEELFGNDAEIFGVCLVVEGGIGTIETVRAAVEAKTPVLAIEGSGRAADAIAYAWRFMHDGRPEASAMHTRSGLRQHARMLLVRKPEMSQEEYDELIYKTVQELLEVVTTNDYVSIFSMHDYDTDHRGVDSALLDAILKSLRVRPILKSTQLEGHRLQLLKEAGDPMTAGLYEMHLSKLYLSLVFDRVDVARTHLNDLKPIAKRLNKQDDAVTLSRAQKYWRKIRDFVVQNQAQVSQKHLSRFQESVESGLMWAMTSQRFDFVKLFLPLVNIVQFCYRNNAHGMEMLLTPHLNRNCRLWLEELYVSACNEVTDNGKNYKKRNSFTLINHNDGKGALIGQRIKWAGEGYTDPVTGDELKGGLKQNINIPAPHRAAIPKFPLLNLIVEEYVFDASDIHGAKAHKEYVPLAPLALIQKDKGKARQSAFHDLMCWAVITGHVNMASESAATRFITNALFDSAPCSFYADVLQFC